MTTLSIKTVATLPEYAILAGYPGIMRIRHEAKHETIYCIKTTPGLPEACRSRRLAPDKLKGGKTKFELMLRRESSKHQRAYSHHHYT